ncbi:MAG: hypothetical protein NXI18_15450 [Alphaproteobacteria bacterium]|nr:hypothetical protein [Alphaproteobacteria bacterium]
MGAVMAARLIAAAAGLAAGLVLPAAADAWAQDISNWGGGAAEWAPVASEHLVRLPAGYIEKAIERDFQDSALADALRSKAEAIEGTAASLAELQEAADSAGESDGGEARHRFLVAKQEYVALMGARQDLERRRVETRIGLFRRLLDRIDRSADPGDDPARAELEENRKTAMQRFAGSADAVDMKLFASATADDSRYAREYRRRAAAIADLVRAIDTHPMNAAPELDGRAMGKAEYLNHLLAAAETEIALLDQKDLVLAYMAKLVALDAMALADEIDQRHGSGPVAAGMRDVTAAVDFFTAPD